MNLSKSEGLYLKIFKNLKKQLIRDKMMGETRSRGLLGIEERLWDRGGKWSKLGVFIHNFAWWGWRKWKWDLKNYWHDMRCPDCGKVMEVWVKYEFYQCKKCGESYSSATGDCLFTIGRGRPVLLSKEEVDES